MKVKEEDSIDHKFLAIMQSPFIEVSGSVNFEGEDSAVVFREDPRAIVELYEKDKEEEPVQSW